jgi:hypothetical protein
MTSGTPEYPARTSSMPEEVRHYARHAISSAQAAGIEREHGLHTSESPLLDMRRLRTLLDSRQEQLGQLRTEHAALLRLLEESRKREQERLEEAKASRAHIAKLHVELTQTRQQLDAAKIKPESQCAAVIGEGMQRLRAIGGPLARARVDSLDKTLAYLCESFLSDHEARLAQAVDGVHAQTLFGVDKAIAEIPRPPIPASEKVLRL